MSQPVTILVIDDDTVFRKTLAFTLTRRGYETRVARDGEEGLQLAEAEAPDLVICDVMMRGMHGYATVAALRDTPGLEHTPVIMITGQGNPLGERRARAHGADYYLHKPFKLPELLDLIGEALAEHGPA